MSLPNTAQLLTFSAAQALTFQNDSLKTNYLSQVFEVRGLY